MTTAELTRWFTLRRKLPFRAALILAESVVIRRCAGSPPQPPQGQTVLPFAEWKPRRTPRP